MAVVAVASSPEEGCGGAGGATASEPVSLSSGCVSAVVVGGVETGVMAAVPVPAVST